ncbi:MAG: hypothetical protein OXT06_30470 [Rhodospirillaceae bacterium]|nr:hypothetical protein [Rhodospirillaceae bacterium]
MLLCGDTAYQWRESSQPQPVATNVVQVGVGRDAGYALTRTGDLLTWQDNPAEKRRLLDRVSWFAAGRTGVFAGRQDGTLLYLDRPKRWLGEGSVAAPETVARDVIAASIGDSANYYVRRDGKLEPTDRFVAVASAVAAVKAHTGHALHLTQTGTVMGTGGNIYGPLGRHGIGDKAISWGAIFENAAAIATGSSHSLAIKADGSLWRWGRDIGLEPVKVLDDVAAAAADQSGSVALLKDGSLWQWARGETPERHFQCPR